MTMLESALGLASQGFRVFPLQEWSKVPATGNGFKSATKNPDQVGTWFSQLKRNIGIATGKGLLVFDCDVKEGKNGIDVLKQLEKELGTLPATLTAQTQSGGTHYYFSIPNTLDIRNATNWNGEGLDIRCNGGYVVAPPSSTRQGSYEWIHQSDIASLPQAWLDKLTPQKSKPSTPTFNSNISSDTHLLDDVREALGFIDAHDYDTWVKVGMACYSMSNFDLWDEWSKSATNYNPSIMVKKWKSFTKGTKVNIESIFYMAQVNGWKNAATTRKDEFLNHGAHIAQQLIKSDQDKVAPNKFTFTTGKSLFKLEPPKWLVKSMIPDASLIGVYGASGSKKSFIAIDIACCVATGKAFAGHHIQKQGKVVYIAGEGLSGLSKRIAGWNQRHDIETLQDNFLLSDRVAMFPEDAQELGEALKNHEPVLIVLDTLQRTMHGNENDTKDMSAYIQGIDTLRAILPDVSIMIIHHTGHMVTDRARGSSVFRASLDAEMRVTDEGQRVSLSCTKSKDSEPFNTLSFNPEIIELNNVEDEEGEPVTTLLLNHNASFLVSNQPTAMTSKQAQAFDIFKSLCIDNSGVTSQHWLDECKAKEVITGQQAKPSKFKSRIIEPLVAHGVIHKNLLDRYFLSNRL